MPDFTTRFAVGRPGENRSREWRLWSKGEDVYLAAREAGGLLKVSLHGRQGNLPPICQLSIVDTFHESLPPERRAPVGRHIERWYRAGPDGRGDFLGTRLLIPLETLKLRSGQTHPDTVWLPAPNSQQAMEVAMMFRPPGEPWSAPDPDPRLNVLVESELRSGEQFRAMYYLRELSDRNISELAALKARTETSEPVWLSRPINEGDSHLAALLFGIQEDGGHRIVDTDVDRDQQPNER